MNKKNEKLANFRKSLVGKRKTTQPKFLLIFFLRLSCLMFDGHVQPNMTGVTGGMQVQKGRVEITGPRYP